MSPPPLSVRNGQPDPNFEKLHDGVPEWLRSSVKTWTKPFFKGVETKLVADYEAHLRVRIPTDPRQRLAGRSYRFEDLVAWATQTDRMLDVVDLTLRLAPTLPNPDPYVGLSEHVGELEWLLQSGGSAWMVHTLDFGWELRRRVSAESQAQHDAAVAASRDPDRHLERAWSAAFGRTPDPSTAFRDGGQRGGTHCVPSRGPEDGVRIPWPRHR